MQLVQTYTLFVHLILIAQTFLVGASSLERRSPVSKASNGLPNRRMIAARSTSSLKTRQVDIKGFLRHEHVLPFIDGRFHI